MIKIEHVEAYGWEAAVCGARNPMNSWHLSDSYWTHIEDAETHETAKFEYFLGEKDLALLKKLSSAGSDHGKFLRMITVTLDITAPLYWWKEFDTYKVGTVANSCSTMHKIHAKEFTLDDFSHEHLVDEPFPITDEYVETYVELLGDMVICLNRARERYLETKDKKYWWQMIQLLPSSYNQKRTVQLNYQVLKSMHHARKAHRLDEWCEFCSWIETLPYAKELIVGEGE